MRKTTPKKKTLQNRLESQVTGYNRRKIQVAIHPIIPYNKKMID